ncbi:hypothetical protein ACF3NR_08840 [Vaginella massiliensis]|uniref:hypothetical protein n=1 Tax=Vaginella massiliensis TaxID=1816680 RepID=UPI0013906EBF|nr:hypothetical protein [Vaginella massiliensis]
MRKNLILAALFFVIFLGLKLIFDQHELGIQILHSTIATVAFLAFRMIFRKNKN